MLVDKQDANVLALLCETIKSLLNRMVVCLRVYDQEVLLCIRRRSDMLPLLVLVYISKVVLVNVRQCRQEASQLQSPADPLGMFKGNSELELTSSPITARNCLSL